MYELFSILREQGRSVVWLARQVEYSPTHLYHVKLGQRTATARLRRRIARVMQIPEATLFRWQSASSADRIDANCEEVA